MLVLSFIFAYLLSGFSQLSKDMNARPMDAPMWTHKPTARMAFLVFFAWPFIQFIGYMHGKLNGRAIAYWLLGVLTQLAAATFLVFCCLFLATYITGNFLLQLLLVPIFIVAGLLFLMPLLTLIMIPVTLVLALPIEFLFPLEDKE